MTQKIQSKLILYIFCSLFLLVSCSKTTKVGFWYTWKNGDSLEKLSTKYQISILELRKINEIYDSADLANGIQVFIPRKQKVSSSTSRPVIITARQNTNKKMNLAWPANGTLSSGFGFRGIRMHYGVDLTKDRGRSIFAAEAGVVEFSGKMRGFGKTIIIKHQNGVKTLYAHSERLYVSKGQRVRKKQIISKMGTTGRSTGIHLHFEVHVQGKPQNPLRFLPIR
ncbi:MAG: murein DD-endopeptidase MepM/ murein hydrolase activator NlpD [bacterium]|jgi:murein DD-endopeptidase MepM/ murein hydrolase activator NlpD